MDVQDIQDGNFSYGALTRTIIGCSFDVIKELGAGSLESVYEKALVSRLIDACLNGESQKSIQVQIINKLNATGLTVGLLINFGNPKLECKRFTRSPPHSEHPVHQC